MQYKFIKVAESVPTPKLSQFFEEVVSSVYDLNTNEGVKDCFTQIKLLGEQFSVDVKDSDANALIDILANVVGNEVNSESLENQFKKYFEI